MSYTSTQFLVPYALGTQPGGNIDASVFDINYNSLSSSTSNVANLAYSATGSVNVSANSGSTLLAQQLNFINTSTVGVTVVAGSGTATGNANVSFSVAVGAGAQGTQGTAGSNGFVGSNGAPGAQGTQGRTGTAIQGTQGPAGSVQGTQGLQGPQGTQGTQGTQGITGTGLQGTQGFSGPQGTQGASGPTNLPQNSESTAYTLQTTDVGKFINITTGGVTVPSGVFSIGDIVSIYNNSATSQTITQGTSATLRLAGTAVTGNRTLDGYGVCTLLCVATNTFVISGAGLF